MWENCILKPDGVVSALWGHANQQNLEHLLTPSEHILPSSFQHQNGIFYYKLYVSVLVIMSSNQVTSQLYAILHLLSKHIVAYLILHFARIPYLLNSVF